MNALGAFALNVPAPAQLVLREPIPRDQTCWYCQHGEHARCADLRPTSLKLCACYACKEAK